MNVRAFTIGPKDQPREVKPQHLISVSGGKDSTSVYLLALERGVPFRAVFADTGNEHPATYEYVERLHERAGGPKVETVRADFAERMAGKRDFIRANWAKDGVPQEQIDRALEILQPTGVPFLDLCLWKGRFPSSQAQFCTEELKVEPITMQIVFPMLRYGPVLQWLGIRAEESVRRSRQSRFNRADDGSMLWRPIFDWKLADVWAMHAKHGIGRNPLYDDGCTRVGCMPCVNVRKDELRLIADRYPEHIERIAAWEAAVSAAAKRGASSFLYHEDGFQSARIEQAVRWSRTARGGKQFDLFFAEQIGGGCNSDLGTCERVAA